MSRRFPRVVARGVGAATLVLAGLLAGAPAAAQRPIVQPWAPPSADSLVGWAAEARVRFRSNAGDSVSGANYRAYELVGHMGRRLLRSLGRENMSQAHAIQAVLDSLGLDTDVLVDAQMPHFSLLMVRNPHRLTAGAVGFLYWYRDRDLRMQGALFPGGVKPTMRVWWTGWKEAPYSWGVVDRTRGEGEMRLAVFRLVPTGTHWTLVQWAAPGFKLGSAGSVAWADINGDEKPELLAYVSAENDSLFDECSGCPRLVNELIFVEAPEGFRLHDTRIVPSPYSTFVLFVRLLLDGNRAQAARLVMNPTLVDRAVAAGWGSRRAHGTWRVEASEPGTPWPQWFVIRFRGARGDARVRVHFEMSRGRWVIRDWTSLDAAGRRATPAPSPGAR